MRYPTWLKRLLLPYEFEDHPLHYVPEPDLCDEFTDEEWEEIWSDKPMTVHRSEQPDNRQPCKDCGEPTPSTTEQCLDCYAKQYPAAAGCWSND